jgi:hypothetical protein
MTAIEKNNPDLNRKLAKIVASAWLDPEYRQQVLEAPKKTFEEAGIDLPPELNLTVVEDTPEVRNVILADDALPPQNQVTRLSPVPDFYSAYSYVYTYSIADPQFKANFLRDPKGTFSGLGVRLPEETTITVYQDTDTQRYFALPMTPRSRITIETNDRNVAVLDATAVNANVNVNANVQANVNAEVNVNGAVQVNGAAVATVVVAVAVLI